MNKVFHQTVPIIALKFMPKEFQDFMLSDGFTEDKIKEISDYPDLEDHDNIENDSLCKHDHSYKLELKEDNQLHWVDGNVLERVKGLLMDARDTYMEKRYEDTKYNLSKTTHYIVDSNTYPHLHRGQPWSKYHERFETELGKFINKNKDKLEQETFVFTPYDDIYKDCRKHSIAMWYKGKSVVDNLEKEIELTDDEKYEICKICIQAIGDI